MSNPTTPKTTRTPTPTPTVSQSDTDQDTSKFNWKLLLAIAIMYVCFIVHFTYHETLLPKKGNLAEDSFHFPIALLWTVNVFSVVAAFVTCMILKKSIKLSPFPYLGISIPQLLSVVCSNYSTSFVDYPTLSLMKSAKPIMVMLCQILIFRKPVNKMRIIVVIIISIGLVVFGYGAKLGKSSYMGIFLAVGSLFCDAIYVPIVDKLKGAAGPYVTMLYAQMWSSIIVGIVRFPELRDAFIFLQSHTHFITNLVLYGLTGAIANIALFTALGMSDGLVVAIATTLRKFCTIIISAILFGHHLSIFQWTGIGIVFFALALENLAKIKHNRSQKAKPE